MKKQLLLLLCLGCTLLATAQQKRIALVIGNDAYPKNQLNNPVNDANLMEATLKSLNFDVIKLTDVNLCQVQNAAIDFAEKIKHYDVALFYYAGHGMAYK